jgi:hypothetical protein
MSPLSHAIINTSLIAIAAICCGSKQKISYYLSIFFFFLGIGYLCKCEAKEAIVSPEIYLNALAECPNAALTGLQAHHMINKIEFHRQQADNCLRKAEEKVWWLPEFKDRERVHTCFTAAVALCSKTTPMCKVVTALLIMFEEYASHCIDEINEINDLLMTAKFHYDLVEFYERVLING